MRIGDEITPYLIACKLADNHRILCASPEYLEQYGEPQPLQILPEYSQMANIWAVYPQRLAHSAKVRAGVEHLVEWFGKAWLCRERFGSA